MLQFRLLWVGIFMLTFFCSHAQPINVPVISSQYINQANDHTAVKLYLSYNTATKKANFLIDKVAKEFSQKTLNDYLEEQLGKLKPELAKQVNIQVHAPKNIPMSYIQDIYIWVQIQGNLHLHIVGREGSEMHYVPIDVMPFPLLESACKYYATKNNLGEIAPLEILAKEHPTTTVLKKEVEEEEVLAIAKSNRAADYIPHTFLEVLIKEGNNVYYKGKQVNPMVLGTMIQADIATNYQSSMSAASAEKYLWLNIKADKTISHEIYLTVLVAMQEGFYAYWDELAFNKYEKTYLELSLEERFAIKGTSPMLITQYDAIELLYIKEKLKDSKGKTWNDLEK